MTEIITLGSDAPGFARRLLSLSNEQSSEGVTRANIVLQRLEDFTQEAVPYDSVQPMLLGILEAADTLCLAEPDRHGFFDFGVEAQIGRIIFQLLRRLNRQDRFAALTEMVSSGRSIATIIREMVVLGQMHGKYGAHDRSPDQDQLVSMEELELLENLAIGRIAQMAEAGSLIYSPALAQVLAFWQDSRGPDACHDWVLKVRDDPEFVASLITSSLGTVYSQGMGFAGGLGDRVARRSYRVSLKFLRRFIDPDGIGPLVQRLLSENHLEDRKRLAFQTFLESSDDDWE